jgi:ribosomal protein S15
MTVSSTNSISTTHKFSAGFSQLGGAWRSLASASVARVAAEMDGDAAPYAPSWLNPRAAAPTLIAAEVNRDMKPDLVRQYLTAEHNSQAEKNKANLARVRGEFQRTPYDVGGSEVQIAQLTEKIKYMTVHFETHRQDTHSRRGLMAMLEQRKRLLKYLRRKDGDSYGEVIYRLGLKDRDFVEEKYPLSNKFKKDYKRKR